MLFGYGFCLVVCVCVCAAVRVNFGGCAEPWTCGAPGQLLYSCPRSPPNDYILHLKDFYTDHISSLTIQNCRELRIVLDCPLLQRTSQLQHLLIKNCDRLEFTSLSSSSLLQTPPDVLIENVKEIISLPKGIFKSPSTTTEVKCLGAISLRSIRIVNSKINTINTNAIYNVSGIKSIDFDNVTILDVKQKGIDVNMEAYNAAFTMTNSDVQSLEYNAMSISAPSVTFSENNFGDITSNALNITSDHLYMYGNTFKEVNQNGFLFKSVNTDISNNVFTSLKTNALASVKCGRKRTNRKDFKFTRNRIESVGTYSLIFDYASCKSSGTRVVFSENKMDCRCRNISFLNSATSNLELNQLVLDLSSNNTCLATPCTLPVEVVKLLMESDMCRINLDPQVMCLLYTDRHTVNEVTPDEEITEPSPTLYMVRQANAPNDGAAMTAIDKDLLQNRNFNMTNRTQIKIVFDSSRDFVETLRSTSNTRKQEASAPPQQDVSRCVGSSCRNTPTYNKQKALDFYKYVYAQLRQPKLNDIKKKKT